MAKQKGVTNMTEEAKLQVIGVDHGNGYVKAYTGDRSLLLPNQFVRKDMLQADPFWKSKLVLDEFVSNKHENETYLWGADIYKALNPINTYTEQDRYIQKPYKLLSEFTLAEMVEDRSVLHVITGVPSIQIGSKAEIDLKKVFEGTHVVTKNGEDKVIKVKQVDVLTQPLGTVMYLYLDDEGNVVDPDIEEEHIGILDCGSGSFDLEGISHMKTVTEDRDTIGEGLFKVYRRISDYINKEHPEAKATPKLVEFQILGDEPDSYRVSKRVAIDIKKVKDQVFGEYVDDIIPLINQRWTNRSKFDRLVLGGGGAKPLSPYLLNWEKDLIVPKAKSVQSVNSIGFYRFGVAINNG